MFKSIECWVCGADMNYLYDKEIEDIGFYRFDCTKCDESVLCPKKAPFLKKIIWNYCEVNGYGYFKNYNRVMVGFCSNTNII